MKNIILDTDMGNEVDDQFALAYLIKSLDKEELNLQAITIAPFSNSGYANTKTIEEGTELSFKLTCNILSMLDKNELKSMVYKGALSYYTDKKEDNEGTNKIIEIARKNDMTTIVAIGAITNVALALDRAPDITDKIEVIWLGGNSFLSDRNDEFNFRQDIEGVRKLFSSKVNLTVIPCLNVASNMGISIYELQHYIGHLGEIGSYLCQAMKDCKKAFTKSPLDEVGQTKTIWDLASVAFAMHKEWFATKEISCPEILDDLSYAYTTDNHKINFVSNLSRHKIYQDFFLKMGYSCK